MSDKPSGYGTMQIGGQERPYHVGVHQSDAFCRLRGITLKEYGELFSYENLKDQKLLPNDYADFTYSALVAGYEWDNLRVDFTPIRVRAWVGDPETSAEEAQKPLVSMLEQVVQRVQRAAERAGNAPAPLKVTKGGSKKKDKS